MSDKSRVKYSEIVKVFGVSKPMNDAQINAIKVTKVKTEKLTCTGEIYLVGPVMTTLKITQPISFADGTSNLPSISFINDLHTGLFRASDGSIGMSVNGTTPLKVGSSNIVTSVPLTTSSGDLLLSAAGPNIDFGGKNLINYGSLVSNPNRYDLVSNMTLTTNSTPTLAMTVNLDIAAYAIDMSIVGAVGSSYIVFVVTFSIRNPSGTPNISILKKSIEYGPDPSLASADFQLNPVSNAFEIKVIGTSNPIKWRIGLTLTRQLY